MKSKILAIISLFPAVCFGQITLTAPTQAVVNGVLYGTTTNTGTISGGTVDATTLKQSGTALGTAAFLNTGTGASQIPTNSSLGTSFIASNSGTFSGTMVGTANSTIDLSSGTAAFPLIFKADSTIRGVMWDSQTTIGYETGQNKMRITSKKRIDILPSQDFQGDGFIQLGNHSPNSELIFFGPEGDATASRLTVSGHRVPFESVYWNGSASTSTYVNLMSSTGTDGKAYLSVYAPGTATSGTLSGSVYNFSPGTETVRLAQSGVLAISGTPATPSYGFLTTGSAAITGLGMSASGTTGVAFSVGGTNRAVVTAAGIKSLPAANHAPAVTGPSSTTGLGFFGSDWQLVRGGTLYLSSDSVGLLCPTAFFAQGAFNIATAGQTMSVQAGTNGLAGTVTLTAGAGSVVSTNITTNTVIQTSLKTASGANGPLEVQVFSGSATFTGLATDAGTYNWLATKVSP